MVTRPGLLACLHFDHCCVSRQEASRPLQSQDRDALGLTVTPMLLAPARRAPKESSLRGQIRRLYQIIDFPRLARTLGGGLRATQRSCAGLAGNLPRALASMVTYTIPFA